MQSKLKKQTVSMDEPEKQGGAGPAAVFRPGALQSLGERLRPRGFAISALLSYQALFWAYVGAALLIFTFMVPPFQKSDEPAHWFRAVSLTNLNFVCAKNAEGVYAFDMKRKYSDTPFMLHVWEVAFNYKSKFNTAWLKEDFADPRFRQEVPVPEICNLPPPGYLPNSLGILAGKPFQNPLISFYLGRAAGALFFVAAIVLALRVVAERYKLIVYFYAAIPMVLHQVGAISYDAVHLSLFPLVFAYLTRFLEEEGRIRPRDLIVFMFLIWWVINVRSFAYYGLILLFFVVPWRRVAGTMPEYLKVSGAFLGLAALTTAIMGVTYLTESHLLTPDAFGIDASRQVRFALEHPWHFVAASYRTLTIAGDLLLREGVGVFGWIDYGFNFLPYYAVIVAAGVLWYYIAEKDSLRVKPAQLLFLWAAMATTVGCLFLSLYAVWSPVGSGVVGGLQGRYFLGLLPFAMLGVSQTAATVGKANFLKALVLLLGLFLLASMVKAIEGRYY